MNMGGTAPSFAASVVLDIFALGEYTYRDGLLPISHASIPLSNETDSLKLFDYHYGHCGIKAYAVVLVDPYRGTDTQGMCLLKKGKHTNERNRSDSSISFVEAQNITAYLDHSYDPSTA
ncbi:hypothetical protein AWENTII_000589 [Aspergillus wentii]